MTDTRLIFDEISRERASQDEEWGGADHDDSHERADWVKFIEKQCRLARTAKDRPLDDYESRMVKIAALAVAAIESNRRERMTTGADWAEDRERYGMMQPEVVPYRPTAHDTLATENARLITNNAMLRSRREAAENKLALQRDVAEKATARAKAAEAENARLRERLRAMQELIDNLDLWVPKNTPGGIFIDQYLAKYVVSEKGGE